MTEPRPTEPNTSEPRTSEPNTSEPNTSERQSGSALPARKPAGVSFETWIDRQIREAQARGEFDNLPGAGKPLPESRGYDELWWVKQLIEREQVSLLPVALQLRKEVQDLRAGLADVPTEAALRDLLDDLNVRIMDELRRPPSGPPMTQSRLDVEDVVRQWRTARAELLVSRPPEVPRPQAPVPAERGRRWWPRRRPA